MKTAFLSLAVMAALLTTSPSMAATGYQAGQERRPAQVQQGDRKDRDPRNEKDFNYGYDKNHKVTPQERAKWEKEHKDDRRDDRNTKDFNYGYDKNHKVTLQERAKWEAAHPKKQQDDRKDHDPRNEKDFNYGYDKNHKVTPQERAKWEKEHKGDRR